MLLGRIGTAFPRVPTAVTTPGGVYQGPPARQGSAAPQPNPLPRAPFYGRLELPKEEIDEGPANGLTLDQAIELLVHRNLDLRAKYLEIPQARADVLTASLRPTRFSTRTASSSLTAATRSTAPEAQPNMM